MRRLRLSSGRYAFVDDADYEFLRARYRWDEYRVQRNRTSYAMASIRFDGRKTTVKMHRILLDAKPGQIVDHIDQNGLNNQKSNLRFTTASRNKRNAPKYRTSGGVRPASRFKGVGWDPSSNARKPWRARIRVNCKLRCLGRYSTEWEAALAYKRAAGVADLQEALDAGEK